jgi:hypothetical protein
VGIWLGVFVTKLEHRDLHGTVDAVFLFLLNMPPHRCVAIHPARKTSPFRDKDALQFTVCCGVP